MTVHHKGKWTPGEDQQLLELVAGGRSWLSIGLKLRRPTSSVRNRMYLLRKGRRSATENEEPTVREVMILDPSTADAPEEGPQFAHVAHAIELHSNAKSVPARRRTQSKKAL